MARNGLAHNEPYLAWNGRYMAFNGIAVHRLIWEEHFGTIHDGLCVHHINNDKFDNRIENLELISRADHCVLHQPRLGFRSPIARVCKICGGTRNEKEVKTEPHRHMCNKCRGSRYSQKRKDYVTCI